MADIDLNEAFRPLEGHQPNGASTSTSGWSQPMPKPLPLAVQLPPVEPYFYKLLPTALADYVEDVAERQQAPRDFAAVAAVCGAAAALGNKVRIAPKRRDDWTVTPNLWGVIIGRPSAMKSPALAAALAPLYRLQDDERTRWHAQEKQRQLEERLAVLDAKDAAKKASKALTGGDRDEARRLLEQQAEVGTVALPCPRLVVNDATVERLGELMNENPTGLLLVRDELPAWLARMDAVEFEQERGFYLEAFNGDGRFAYDRIGRGTVVIECCTLSIIGGAQPSRIAPLVRSAMNGSKNDGLIQRLQMAVWPDDPGSWKWVDREPDAQARAAYDAVFERLYRHPFGTATEPAVLRFTDEAQQLFREWMEEIQVVARRGDLAPVMESHLQKLPKTVASLALIFELVDGGVADVGVAAVERALAWTEYLRSHARRIYSAGDISAETGARLIVERRAKLLHPFTARDIQRKGWAGLIDADEVTAALNLLVEKHHVRTVGRHGGEAGGRPTDEYWWNPQLQMGH